MSKPPLIKKLYCMNLERRPDRWESVQKEIAKLGPEYELIRFNAIENKQLPAKGHSDTFISMVQNAKLDNQPHILIVEDDLLLHSKTAKFWESAYSKLPDDWDILLGGCYYIKGRTDVTDGLAKVTDFCSTHYILLNSKCYDKVISFNDNNLKLKNIDRFMGKLSAKGELNCYLVWPMIAKQDSGYSDLRKRTVDDNKNTLKRGLIFLEEGEEDKIDEIIKKKTIESKKIVAKAEKHNGEVQNVMDMMIHKAMQDHVVKIVTKKDDNEITRFNLTNGGSGVDGEYTLTSDTCCDKPIWKSANGNYIIYHNDSTWVMTYSGYRNVIGKNKSQHPYLNNWSKKYQIEIIHN
jgi:glycosyl transferase, family 25